MTRRPAVLVPAASLLAVLSLSGCVPAPSASANPFGEFASADDSGQVAMLLAAEDAVAAAIQGTPGPVARRVGASDAELGLGVTRADASQLVFRDISSIAEAVGEVLRADDSGISDDGMVGWSDGREVGWKLESGKLTGTYDYEDGDATSASDFTINACPDASGRFSGHAKLVGASGSIGWEVVFNFSGQVGDDAYAKDMVVEGAGTLDGGGSTQDSNTTVSFAFGATGTTGLSGDGTSGGAANSWDQALDDFVSKASLRFARLLEENWRSGACVEVLSDPESGISLAPGEQADFEPLPESKLDGSPITTGTVTGELASSEGKLSPAGPQTVGTELVYSAGSNPGTALVALTSVSRRGIGFGEVEFDIAGGWTFTETYATVTSTALKCGGLTGPWVMNSTAPWAYEATTSWTFDESLRAVTTIAGTAGGIGFGGSNEVWLVETAPGTYELHASDGPNIFYLKPAAAGEC